MAGVSLLTRVDDIIGENVFAVDGKASTHETYNTASYAAILLRFAKEAARDVVDKQLTVNPKDMHLFTQNILIRPMGAWGDVTNNMTFSEHTIPWKDNDGGFFIDNNYILWVGRDFGGITVPAQEVSAEKGLKTTDPDSIFYTGTDYRNPVFYRSSSKLYITPDITEADEGRASLVSYDNQFTMANSEIKYFPNHLLYLVVLYVSRRALKILLGQKRDEYTLKYSTPTAVWSTLYEDEGMPSIPTFPTDDVLNFGDYEEVLDGDGVSFDPKQYKGFKLDYLFPSIDFNEDGTATTETVQKVMTNLWNRIHEEEEPDLVTSELSRFNAIISEYQTRLGTLDKRQANVMAQFTAKMGEFQQKFSTVMDVWTRYQNSYKIESELLVGEIGRLEQEYTQNFYPKHTQDKLKEEGT